MQPIQTPTVKGLTRIFRKRLKSWGKQFPLSGPFVVRIDGKLVTDPRCLPVELRGRLEVCRGVPSLALVPVVFQATAPAPTPTSTPTAVPDRVLCKRVVRDSTATGGKRRVDYRPARNPKPGDGVQYWAKVDGRWREVPAQYADPDYQLPGEQQAA